MRKFRRKQKTKNRTATPTVTIPPPQSLEQTAPADNEKPETSPLSHDNGDSHPPSVPQHLPRKRPNKSVAFVLSLLSVFVLIFIPVIGIIYQANVNATNRNADATVYAVTDTANAVPTATFISANPDPYDNADGKIELYDPLTQPSYWDSDGVNCLYKSGGYHIVASQKNNFTYCDATSLSENSFVFEVKMTINQGDCGGMDLRLHYDTDTFEGYVFFVCSDGTYNFWLYNNDKNDKFAKELKSGKNSGVTSGKNATIAVIANGSNFTFYVNNTQLNIVSDTTYSDGDIGLIASDNTNKTEVTYSKVRVWTLYG